MEFYDVLALYRLFKSLYSHFIVLQRKERRDKKIGYKETWNSTTTTLVLLRARSTATIHGTDEHDEYIQ